MIRLIFAFSLAAALAAPQSPTPSRTLTEGSHRMELVLERLDRDTWRAIDPGLVLAQGDRVRFKFRTNFDGYLYVMNQSTSGNYEQLFPTDQTIVYWLVNPGRLTGAGPRYQPPPAKKAPPAALMPRCDDTILKARGDCVDPTAGPKLVPRGEAMPQNLTLGLGREPRDLLFMRQKNTAVISSPVSLTGPVIYEYRLAHR
jgi:hypothetical protein